MSNECSFDVVPLKSSSVISNSPVYNLNYTSQDYSSMKARLLELIKNNFGSEFNDITEASLGIMLIESWAWLADLLSFKIDQLANELFIDTVTEVDNAFRLAKLVGFKPHPPLPAKAMFIVNANGVYTSDIEIKTPLSISMNSAAFGMHYELFPADTQGNPIFGQPIIIPAGNVFNSQVVGLEGISHSMNYKSNGKAHQTFTIPYESIFGGSVFVYVDNTLWEEVDYFTEYQPRPEFVVNYDSNYKVNISFGNNKAGIIPPQGSSISIKCRGANKATAEVITGGIQTMTYAHIDSVPHAIAIQIKNYTKSEGGYPGDTIEDVRKKLPLFLRTQDRAVTGTDYQFLASQFSSAFNGTIGKATAVLRNHGCAGNVIDIVVLAQTGNHRLVKAEDNLKSELLAFLNKRKMFTDYICIKDGEVLFVDINIDLFLDKIHKKAEESIKNKIVESLNWFFSLQNWDFGKSLRESDIIKILADVREIKHIELSFTTVKSLTSGFEESVISPSYREIIRPDNVNINFTYKAPGDI